MSEWVLIDAARHRRTLPTSQHAGHSSTVSPYDIPEAMRVRVEDRDGDVLVIEFRYTTEEPLVWKSRGDRVSLGIGKNSGRLYKIHARMPGVSAGDRVRVTVGEAGVAIDRLVGEESLSRRHENYGIAKNLLTMEQVTAAQ
jgi:hypothetical protein